MSLEMHGDSVIHKEKLMFGWNNKVFQMSPVLINCCFDYKTAKAWISEKILEKLQISLCGIRPWV